MVEYCVQVQFVGDVGVGFYQNFGDWLVVFIGLECYQVLVQLFFGEFCCFFGVVDQFYVIGFIVVIGVYLGFYDLFVIIDFFCFCCYFFWCIVSEVWRNWQVVISKKLF